MKEGSYKATKYKTDYKPVVIYLSVRVKKVPFSLTIGVYDHKRANTAFFVRNEDFTEREIADYTIQLPFTTDEFTFVLFSKDEKLKIDEYIDITRYEVKDFSVAPPNLSEKEQEIVNSVVKFSMMAGYLQPNSYKYAKKYEIRLLPKILTDLGSEHVTPARIHVEEGFIEVSKNKFDKKTVPRRIAILLHEFAHNYINKDQNDEEEADYNAARLYMAMGLPRSEFIYAFSKAFKNYSEADFDKLIQNKGWASNYEANAERLKKAYNYLEQNK